MDSNKPTEFKKQLNPLNVWAIAFGCIIGWGSFINPHKKFLPNSGVAGTAIAMLLGAVIMVIIAFSYAYMVPKFPQAGGEFNFARNCFGKTSAYICGWFLVAAYLTNVPMNSTAIQLIVDGVDGKKDILMFGFEYTIAGSTVHLGEIIFASAILILFGWLNIVGVKKAGQVQTVLAALLAICVATLFIAGLVSAKTKGVNMNPLWGFDKASALDAAEKAGIDTKDLNISPFVHSGSKGILSAILATFAITPWAFVGFGTIPQEAEEFNFSYKKVMMIMTVAIAFGAFVYISNNTIAAATIKTWPEEVMKEKDNWLVLIAAEKLLGVTGKVMVTTGVSCAVLSGIMGFYLASSRLMYSMSLQGYLPKVFGKLDKKYGTPKNAMIFCILISLAGPVLGREAIGWFVDMSSIGASIGYLFTCAATIYTIKKLGERKCVINFLAIIGCIFAVIFMLLQLIPIPGLDGVHFCTQSYILLVVWSFIGFVFYLRQRKTINSQPTE